jgi:DNA-directed RNA polymerase I, II, and III subunit RPABC2
MTTKKKVQFDDYQKTMVNLDKTKISKPIMTKYEFNQVISLRTNQLSLGGEPFIKNEGDIRTNMDFRRIALEEMKQGKLPYIVKRQLPNGKNEYYRLKDLDIIAVQHMMR